MLRLNMSKPSLAERIRTASLSFVKHSVFYRAARRLFLESQAIKHILCDALTMHFWRRCFSCPDLPVTQSPLSWNLDINDISTPATLITFLKSQNVFFIEGGHTIYIPPQTGLANVLKDVSSFYPDDAGYKILKHFSTIDKARYIAPAKRAQISYAEHILTSSIPDIIDSANVMHLFGLGPCLYDVTELHTRATTMTCFVVQHVDGINPTADAYLGFIETLKSLIARNVVALVPPDGFEHIDFLPPHCNKNLVVSCDTNRPVYVDFQSFIVRNKSQLVSSILSQFHDLSLSRKLRLPKEGNHSDISSAHLAEMGKTWHELREVLKLAGLSVARRLVLHVGCQTGGILGCALSEGALWGLGWDSPAMVANATRLQRVLGNTRLNLYAAELCESSPISCDVPQQLIPFLSESILFYSPQSPHAPIPSELKTLPWKALVFFANLFEHGADQSRILAKLQRDYDCRIAAKLATAAAHSPTGTCLVLLRSHSP